MATFRFKLEPVLRQRRLAEDQAQRALAKLLRERMILEQQVRRLQQTIADDKRSMASALVGQVDVDRIRRHGVFSHRSTVHVQAIAVKLLELTRRIETSRQALLQASRDRKAVERLREKQFRRWRAEQNRRESAQLDEFAIQQHGRRVGRPWEAVA